jgi:hypothetical protein
MNMSINEIEEVIAAKCDPMATRITAIKVAREVLRTTSAFGGSTVQVDAKSTDDLLRIADWLIHGEDNLAFFEVGDREKVNEARRYWEDRLEHNTFDSREGNTLTVLLAALQELLGPVDQEDIDVVNG